MENKELLLSLMLLFNSDYIKTKSIKDEEADGYESLYRMNQDYDWYNPFIHGPAVIKKQDLCCNKGDEYYNETKKTENQ